MLTSEFCFFLTSKTRALRDPQENPAVCRALDARDGSGHRRLQTEAQGAENTLPGRHREDVRRQIAHVPRGLGHFDMHT